MRLAWTGPPARFACTGWDTCPTSLAPVTVLAVEVLLNAIQKVKSLNYLTLVGHLHKVLVGHQADRVKKPQGK